MNYQLEMEKELDKLKNLSIKPKLLLHACCGPCSSYVIEYLSNFFDITIYYYNPNIYPESEYIRRKEEAKRFVDLFNKDVKFIECDYNPDEYYLSVKGLEELGEKSKRCYECYKLRMNKAALYAKEENFDYFTTTLSISPYKVSSWINEIGENLSKEIGINYLYADFKKKNGFKRSLELSKEYNMYRQDYCGCLYSYKNKVGE